MSNIINLDKAELNKDYIIADIAHNPEKLKNFGIYSGAPITPLYRSIAKSICAYKTYYGVFAIRNDTAKDIMVQNG